MSERESAWNGRLLRPPPAALARVLGGGARRVLYRGGPILTMDPANRIAEALLVEGDRISAVDGDAELRGQSGGKTRIVDLAGQALLPGFIDAHAHFPGAGIFAVFLDLNSPPSATSEASTTSSRGCASEPGVPRKAAGSSAWDTTTRSSRRNATPSGPTWTAPPPSIRSRSGTSRVISPQ